MRWMGDKEGVLPFCHNVKSVGILCWILQESVAWRVFQNKKEKTVYNFDYKEAGSVILIFQEVLNLQKLSKYGCWVQSTLLLKGIIITIINN